MERVSCRFFSLPSLPPYSLTPLLFSPPFPLSSSLPPSTKNSTTEQVHRLRQQHRLHAAVPPLRLRLHFVHSGQRTLRKHRPFQPGLQGQSGVRHAVPRARNGEKEEEEFSKEKVFPKKKPAEKKLSSKDRKTKKPKNRPAPTRPTSSTSSSGRTTTSTRSPSRARSSGERGMTLALFFL